MDFIVGLPQFEGYNAIFIVVDRLIKERYYILYTITNKGTLVEYTAEILINEVFRLYKLSILIVSNRGP